MKRFSIVRTLASLALGSAILLQSAAAYTNDGIAHVAAGGITFANGLLT